MTGAAGTLKLPASAAPSRRSGSKGVSAVQFKVAEEPKPKATFNNVVPRALPWDAGRFQAERKLQDASRNDGAVHLMRDAAAGGGFVAVKQMPLTWTQKDPASFAKVQPESSERPWYDIAIVSSLNEKGCGFVCKFIGVFLDHTYLYVVCDLATEGDLFDWCGVLKDPPGPGREAVIQPIVKQLCAAAMTLHNYGICHRDVSMENVLLHQEPAGIRVKLIDFGMATTARNHRDEIRGKYPYQAPEMHRGDGAYDGFLSDTFAIGVVVFCLAVKDYPWRSTQPGNCKTFDLAAMVGLSQWLPGRKLLGGRGKRLTDVLSKPFSEFLQGALELQPQSRFTLGERCWRHSSSGIRPSVWGEDSWLGEDEDKESSPEKQMSWKSIRLETKEPEEDSLEDNLDAAALSPTRKRQPPAAPPLLPALVAEVQIRPEQLSTMPYDDGCLAEAGPSESTRPGCAPHKGPHAVPAEQQQAASPTILTARDATSHSQAVSIDKGCLLKSACPPPRMISFIEARPEFEVPAF